MHGKLARETFKNGYNCAQSVLATFGPALGIERDASLKMASGLGSGGNYNGKICGAVMGAFIVLGLKYGSSKAFDKETRDALKLKLDTFSDLFRKKHGSIICNDLLHADISNPIELQKLRDNNVFETVCPKLVEDAADLIDMFLSEQL